MHLGQSYKVTLPQLDFELGNNQLPLQIKVDSGNPVMSISWSLTLAFGFDETSGYVSEFDILDPFQRVLIFSSTCSFFLYTFPGKSAEFFIKADLFVPLGNVNSKLLYFLDFALADGTSITTEFVSREIYCADVLLSFLRNVFA